MLKGVCVGVIDKLVDSKILEVIQTYDYWQICTDTGIINIYNPLKYVS